MVSQSCVNQVTNILFQYYQYYQPFIEMETLTPEHVSKAVDRPNFYENHDEFWKMLNFLFTTYNGSSVWRQIHPDIFRKIIEQLHVVLESTENYSTIKNNQTLLYHIYLASLISTRGSQSVQQYMAYEKDTVLQGLYYLYKQLHALKMPMPLFCNISETQTL